MFCVWISSFAHEQVSLFSLFSFIFSDFIWFMRKKKNNGNGENERMRGGKKKKGSNGENERRKKKEIQMREKELIK